MILRFIATAVAVSVIVGFLQAQKVTAGLEARWIDFMGTLFPPDFNQPLVVVAVTQADFDSPDLFGGLSPLDPGQLTKLVCRVAEHHPRGVVLDVLIHPAAFESPSRSAGRVALYDALDSLAAHTDTKWILARSPEDEPAIDQVDPIVAARWQAITEPRVGAARNIYWGVPQFALDNGLVRFAHAEFAEDPDSPPWPTLYGAAVQAIGLDEDIEPSRMERTESGSPAPWLIRFSGQLPADPNGSGPTEHFTRSSVLMRSSGVQGARSILENSVVLIGGTYREGRDFHWTALGPMPGVYIWAEAIASRLRNDAPREVPVWITVLLDAALGIAAGVALARLSHLKRLGLSLVTLMFASVLFSWLTFGAGFLFINFLPSMLGVLIQYQFEIHLELRRLRKDLESYAGT